MVGKDIFSCMQGIVGETLSYADVEKAAQSFKESLSPDERMLAEVDISQIRAGSALKAGSTAKQRMAEYRVQKKWQALYTESALNKTQFILDQHVEKSAGPILYGNKKLHAITNILGGSNEAFALSGRSIESTHNAKQAEYFRTNFINRLEENNLLQYIEGSFGGLGSVKRETEVHIANAIHEKNGGAPAPENTPQWARQIADIYVDARKLILQDFESAGIIVRDYKGFITSVAHNPYRMTTPLKTKGKGRFVFGQKREAKSRQDWIDFTRSRIDIARMEIEQDQVNGVLEEIYDSLIRQIEIEDSTVNIGDQLTNRRQLHWKSPEAQIEYMNQYGYGDFLTNMAFSMERDATNMAAIEWLGTNPKKSLQKLIEWADPTIQHKSQQRKVKNMFDEFTGVNSSADSHILATVGTTLRSVTTAAFLDGSVFTYGMDAPLRAMIMRDFGSSPLGANLKTYLDAFRLMSTDEQKKVARMFGFIEDGLRGSVGRGLMATEGLSGKASGFNQLTFKLNMSDWWVNKQKRGFITAISGLMGDHAGLDFESLPKEIKSHISRFGIDASDWDIIRTEGLYKSDRGSFLVPETIKDRFVAQKFREMMLERANTAVLTPSLASRAAASQGQKRGTVWGEISRSAMQFMTFSYTFQERILIPLLRGTTVGSEGKNRFAMVGGLAASLIAASYMTLAMKNIITGKEVPDLSDRDTAFSILSRSGVFGLQGDLFAQSIFSPYSRSKGISLTEIFEPASWSWLERATSGVDYSTDDGFKADMRAITSAMPYADLPYMGVANYLFINSIRNAIDPQYAEKKIKTGQKYNNAYIESPLNIARPDRELLKDLQ